MADQAVRNRARTSSFNEEDLVRQSTSLKKVTTKEFIDEPSPADVEAIAKIYLDKGENLDDLAKYFNIDAQLLKDLQPESAADFAKSLFAGVYIPDKTEAAKDQLRQNLSIAIKDSQAKLKKSVTRESTGPTTADLAAAAKLFDRMEGDFAMIAAHCGLTERLMNNDPPENAEDFARKVFAGNYTEEPNEAKKNQLREALQTGIVEKRKSLKRTKTNEGIGEPSAEDIAVVAKMYPADIKDLESVAEKLGLTVSLVKAKPPSNAEDFARKALEGAYTQDESEVLKKGFREKLLAGITARRPSLRQVPAVPRRLSNVSEEELSNFGNFFTKHDGDLEAIAKESGLPLGLLRSCPPSDASNFVEKLLEGVYTIDMDEQAKALFRRVLRKEMLETKGKLKKTTTKEWDGSASDEDIKMFAKIYTQKNGNLAKLAELFSLSLDAMNMDLPESPESFAKKVLLGAYTPDIVARRIDAFRLSLSQEVKQHRESLKHVLTKTSSVQPSPGQVAKIAKIYNDLNADLALVGKAVGADFAAMIKDKPTDANDFAVKLLSGAYTTPDVEGFRRRLSGVLHQDLINHPALKHTDTKEKVGVPTEEDIINYAKVFEDNGGNLAVLASVLQCNLALLKNDAPTDACTFAYRYLAGAYQN